MRFKKFQEKNLSFFFSFLLYLNCILNSGMARVHHHHVHCMYIILEDSSAGTYSQSLCSSCNPVFITHLAWQSKTYIFLSFIVGALKLGLTQMMTSFVGLLSVGVQIRHTGCAEFALLHSYCGNLSPHFIGILIRGILLQTSAWHWHVLMCKWFILHKSFQSVLVNRLCRQPRHGCVSGPKKDMII